MSAYPEIVEKFVEALEPFPYYKQEGWSASQVGDVPYFAITVAFTVVVSLMEIYLDFRQLGNFRNTKTMPKELEQHVPLEKFEKSLEYGKDKFSFGILESLAMLTEGMALTFLGYLPFAWDLASQLALRFNLVAPTNSALYQEVVVTVLFVWIMTLHDTILSIPFNLYSTFVVEQKHGFNKSTLGLFFLDKVKMILLTIILGSPIMAMVVAVIRWGGPFFYVYVWAFLFAVSMLMLTIYPTLIAPLFNKYTPLDKGELFESIEQLAAKVGFPLTKIFVVDGSTRSAHSNAYFYGFFKNKRIVLYDTLIKQVEKNELLAILGHEIGHWRLWHTIQGFVVMQVHVFALFLAFSVVQNTPGLFAAFGFAFRYETPMPVFIGLILFMQTFWSPVEKVLVLLMNFNSRHNEFAADGYAKKLGMGDELCSGLIKISIENLGNMVPDPLYSMYHFSHPPVLERLRALRYGSGSGSGGTGTKASASAADADAEKKTK